MIFESLGVWDESEWLDDTNGVFLGAETETAEALGAEEILSASELGDTVPTSVLAVKSAAATGDGDVDPKNPKNAKNNISVLSVCVYVC